jgi:hypothetical protein
MIPYCNKYILLVCLFFGSVAVFSCKKNDKGLRPLENGTYIFNSIDGITFRMYTKNGEVKDQGLIEQYKNKFSVDFNLTNSSSNDTLKILDAANVEYITSDGIRTMRRGFDVTALDNYYQFRSKDTLYVYDEAAFKPQYDIGKYKPTYISIPLPMGITRGRTFQYLYASVGNNSLSFPFLNAVRFATIRNGQYYSAYSYGFRLSNVFDEKFPGTLTTDTVLVQAYTVQCKKVAP